MPSKFRVIKYRGWMYAEWRENGVQRRKALRTRDRESAQQTLKSFVDAYEVANRPDPVTVEFCWHGYRETLKGRPAFFTMGFEARSLLVHLGQHQAAAINEEDCKAYAEKRRLGGIKDGTIWTELGRLRSALKWAERKNLIVKAPAIYRPPIPQPRDLRLTRGQAAHFLSACTMPHARLFVIIALTTGTRMSALLELTWDRVDFDGKTINLKDPTRPQTKKGRAVVPINRTLMGALQEARTGALTPFVIEWAGRPVKSMKRSLASAGRRCGLPWVTAHVLRHTAACLMAERGVSMDRIAAMLGHSDSRVTSRVYARFAPDFLRDAAEALEIDIFPPKETKPNLIKKWKRTLDDYAVPSINAKGGHARALAMSPEQRTEVAKRGAAARWKKER
jgi:integrase